MSEDEGRWDKTLRNGTHKRGVESPGRVFLSPQFWNNKDYVRAGTNRATCVPGLNKFYDEFQPGGVKGVEGAYFVAVYVKDAFATGKRNHYFAP